MDNTNNDIREYENDDNIRPPDADIRETLIPPSPTYLHADAELDKILALSKAEYEMSMNQQIEDMYKVEKASRTDKFVSIKQKVKKILSFDKQHTNKYEMILSIIEMYEQGFITHYFVSQEDHHILLALLQSLRVSNIEIEHFTNIIGIK